MRVLALDLSTTSGAAFDGPSGRPLFSTLKGSMPDDDDFGPLFAKFRAWLCDLIAVQRPDAIVIEAPWIPLGNTGRPTSVPIVYMLVSLAGIAEECTKTHEIDCFKEAVDTVRKHFLGTARPKGDPKKAVMTRCRLLGWPIKNDHEADAAALWCLAKSVLDKTWSPNDTRLFERVSA